MSERLAWAEIDLTALGHNVRALASLLPVGTELCAVVKADAYGHGALRIARAALAAGARRLAVATAEEALALRDGGMTVPILVMGAVAPNEVPELIERRLSATLYSPESAAVFSEAAFCARKPLTVHIQVDTGMSRLGFSPESAVAQILAASRLPGIAIEGIYSHFATADESGPAFVRFQLGRFLGIEGELRKAGLVIRLRHIANSAATIRYPETHLDMVRPGIALYGLWPSPETRTEMEGKIELSPVMSFKTRIVQIRRIATGTPVSYGCAWTAQRESLIGTLPVGYADGWSRLLAGKSEVLLGSRRAHVVGRICMDQTMIDLTDCPGASVGDEVLLFGAAGIGADDVAARMGTINYETVCMVGKRVPRVYVKGGEGRTERKKEDEA